MVALNEPLVVVVRSIIAFFTLLILTRLLGKQQISQLTYFDYVAGITIGSLAAALTSDLSTRALPHWIALLTWMALVLAMEWATLKSRPFSKYVDGEPVVVVMNGQIMEDAMRKMRYRASELLEQLRDKGVFDLTQVEFAVLEMNGKLSALKKSQYQPVTPKDLNLPTNYQGLETELIYDGVVIEQNLGQLNLDRRWLDGELRKQGIAHPAEVFLAVLDTSGNLYVDRYKDRVRNAIDVSDYAGPN